MWFVLYGLAAVLGLTILAVRAQVVPAGTNALAPLDDPASGGQHRPFTPTKVIATAVRVIGAALFVVVLLAALAGDPAGGSNPAPLVVFVAFFMGMAVVSLLGGDVWCLVSPFSTIAAVIERARRSRRARGDDRTGVAGGAEGGTRSPERDWWLPAALLFSFEAWWLVVVDGTRPRGVAVWLLGYSAIMVVGGVIGGRGWCRRNDPFAVVFAAFAELAPVGLVGGRPRWRSALRRLSTAPGTPRRAAVLAVLVGSIAFDHATSTNWWLSKVNQQGEVAFTVINLAGLAWSVGLVAIAWAAACRLATTPHDADHDDDDHDDHEGAGELGIDLSPALLPLTAGLFLGYALPRLLVDLQNVVALSSDPFGRGWDLFGTLGLGLNEQPIGAGVAGWLRLGFLAAGAMASIAVLHRRVLLHAGRPARPVAAPLLGFVVLATLGGTRLVLGT